MKFNDTVGRSNREELLNWFNDGKPEKKILIIQGRSGNGKTLLPILLAESLGYEIQVINPSNIDSSTLETINQSISRKKIILLDDFDDFTNIKKESLYDIIEISRFPVITTCTKYKFGSELFKKASYMRLSRPRSSEILSLLQKHSSLPKSKLYDIAHNSDNVQQALNATLTGIIPEKEQRPLSKKDFFRSLNNRSVNKELERDDILLYFQSIKKYTDDDINTMIAFSYFDYIINQRFAPIEPMIVNSIESLSGTSFKYKPPKNVNEKQHQRPKRKIKKKKKPKLKGIDLYF